MTERELFKALHGRARKLLHWHRLGHKHNFTQNMELVECYLTKALESGMGEDRVLEVVKQLGVTFENKKAQLLEPSRNSVRIQMLVHTFGRVRRAV